MNLVRRVAGRVNTFTPTSVVYRSLYEDVFTRRARPALQKNFETPISKAKEKLELMRFWEEGWTGHSVLAPKSVAIDRAMIWLGELYASLATSGRDKARQWEEPHITASADGEVVFEWWNGSKGLSVYVSETDVSYIKDWGVNIQDEMED